MRKELVGVIVAIVLLALAVLLFKSFSGNAPNTAGGGAVTPSAGGGAAGAAPLPPESPEKLPTIAETLEDFTNPAWRIMNNGMTTDITAKDEIRIHGTSQYADWAHGNGIVATTPLPDGDFTLSVDIKLAKYEGESDYKNPYIRVEARDRSAIGIFANPGFFYRLHDWKNPQTMSATHKMFGDESTKFHRLRLKWADSSGTATATVDNEAIGFIKTSLGPGRRISLFANTQTKGLDIDVYFKNLKVEVSEPPAQPL